MDPSARRPVPSASAPPARVAPACGPTRVPPAKTPRCPRVSGPLPGSHLSTPWRCAAASAVCVLTVLKCRARPHVTGRRGLWGRAGWTHCQAWLQLCRDRADARGSCDRQVSLDCHQICRFSLTGLCNHHPRKPWRAGLRPRPAGDPLGARTAARSRARPGKDRGRARGRRAQGAGSSTRCPAVRVGGPVPHHAAVVCSA